MNPAFNARATTLRVGKETEGTFNDAFWEGLTAVCTALDNVDSRLYIDSKCVFYRKPMLESGTMGTKGNTQVRAREGAGAKHQSLGCRSHTCGTHRLWCPS